MAVKSILRNHFGILSNYQDFWIYDSRKHHDYSGYYSELLGNSSEPTQNYTLNQLKSRWKSYVFFGTTLVLFRTTSILVCNLREKRLTYVSILRNYFGIIPNY